MKVYIEYHQIFETPDTEYRPRRGKLRLVSTRKFTDRDEANNEAQKIRVLSHNVNRPVIIQVLTRTKPKYMSWPTWLGGQKLDDKYWPAYKRHDNVYGKDGEAKFEGIIDRQEADEQLRLDLIDLGCSKFWARFHYIFVQTFNASRWTPRSWERD